jgi:UDP-glucose 4-epimerase
VQAGHRVVVVDNLFRGHRAAVAKGARFARLDLSQRESLARLMRREKVASVMHFAALAYVGESVEQPLRYYQNNVAGTLSLLAAMDAAGVKRLVFSSTCATYGIPAELPIVETSPQQPISPYGWSKRIVEQVLIDKAACDPEFAAVALRYFNVAGCAEDGSLGEDHDPETHLIPVLLLAALGRREGLTIFGTDYPTADGTCIRDYVHVDDLCRAHLLALERLAPGPPRFYNVGVGRGYSVREVLDSARRVTGRRITAHEAPRRAGDPPALWSNAERIERELGWRPQYTEIDAVVETAWRWFRTHPDGYAKS